MAAWQDHPVGRMPMPPFPRIEGEITAMQVADLSADESSARLGLRLVARSLKSVDTLVTRLVLRAASQQPALQLEATMALRGIAAELLQPVAFEERDLANVQSRAARFTGMIPMFVIMAVMWGALTAALDSTAGERERGSLEPLLMNPAPRLALVLGKWGAVATVGMLIAVMSCLSFLPGQWLLRSETLAAMFRFGVHEGAMFLALLLPFYVIAMYAGWRSLKALWPVLLVAGGSFGLGQFLASNYIGYELTDVISALACLVSTLAFLKIWKPAYDPDYALEVSAELRAQKSPVPTWQGWVPWLLLSAIVIALIILGIACYITSGALCSCRRAKRSCADLPLMARSISNSSCSAAFTIVGGPWRVVGFIQKIQSLTGRHGPNRTDEAAVVAVVVVDVAVVEVDVPGIGRIGRLPARLRPGRASCWCTFFRGPRSRPRTTRSKRVSAQMLM